MVQRLTEVQIPHRERSERSSVLTPDKVSHGVHIRRGQVKRISTIRNILYNLYNFKSMFLIKTCECKVDCVYFPPESDQVSVPGLKIGK